MRLTGHFEIDSAGALTLVLRNDGDVSLYVFVPHGRDHGVQIEVLSGPCTMTSLGSEPEAGLVGETSLQPGESSRFEHPLSHWIRQTGGHTCVIRCTVGIETATESLRDNRGRQTEVVTISTEVALAS